MLLTPEGIECPGLRPGLLGYRRTDVDRLLRAVAQELRACHAAELAASPPTDAKRRAGAAFASDDGAARIRREAEETARVIVDEAVAAATALMRQAEAFRAETERVLAAHLLRIQEHARTVAEDLAAAAPTQPAAAAG